MLNPPRAFAVVEPRLFRSAVFARENFSFLRQLKLKTIMYLASEEPSKALFDFCTEEDATFLNFGTHQPYTRAGEWSPLRGDLAKEALQSLLQVDRLPLLIVCLNGIQQTSALVGCLRRLQGWSFTAIIEEHRRFGDVGSRSAIEHYIEIFDVDVVTIPPTRSLPEWFVQELAAFVEEEEEERKRKRTVGAVRS
jgi:protein tyrosine/serine phosphatase